MTLILPPRLDISDDVSVSLENKWVLLQMDKVRVEGRDIPWIDVNLSAMTKRLSLNICISREKCREIYAQSIAYNAV